MELTPEFERDCRMVLERAVTAYANDIGGGGAQESVGIRSVMLYRDIPDHAAALVHLIEVGCIRYATNTSGLRAYVVTKAGIREHQNNPPDKETQIKAEIQRLEQALQAKRAELAALQPGRDSVEQQIAKRWHGYEGK